MTKKKWLMRVGRESESKLYEGALMVSNISPAQPMEMDTFERLIAGEKRSIVKEVS